MFALEPAAKLICRELCRRPHRGDHPLLALDDPAFPAPERSCFTATVSSLRLDAVLSAMLHVSRGQRCGADRGGAGGDQPSAAEPAPTPRCTSRMCSPCAARGASGLTALPGKSKKTDRSSSSFNIDKTIGRKSLC